MPGGTAATRVTHDIPTRVKGSLLLTLSAVSCLAVILIAVHVKSCVPTFALNAPFRYDNETITMWPNINVCESAHADRTPSLYV
jgi:hypothetical protein